MRRLPLVAIMRIRREMTMTRWLRRHEATTLDGGRGVRVHVTQGRVWLTRNGDIKDYVLAAGDAMELESRGLVVLFGLTEASLQLHTPARAPGMWSGLVARFTSKGEHT